MKTNANRERLLESLRSDIFQFFRPMVESAAMLMEPGSKGRQMLQRLQSLEWNFEMDVSTFAAVEAFQEVSSDEALSRKPKRETDFKNTSFGSDSLEPSQTSRYSNFATDSDGSAQSFGNKASAESASTKEGNPQDALRYRAKIEFFSLNKKLPDLQQWSSYSEFEAELGLPAPGRHKIVAKNPRFPIGPGNAVWESKDNLLRKEGREPLVKEQERGGGRTSFSKTRSPRIGDPLADGGIRKSRAGRKAQLYEFGGKNYSLHEWSQELGVSIFTLRARLNAGMPYEKVFSDSRLMTGRRGRYKRADDSGQDFSNDKQLARGTRVSWRGENHTLAEWATILGMNTLTLQARLQRGWPVDRAFSEPTMARGAKYKASWPQGVPQMRQTPAAEDESNPKPKVILRRRAVQADSEDDGLGDTFGQSWPNSDQEGSLQKNPDSDENNRQGMLNFD